MSDEIIVGVFTLLGTLFGTILGFSLTKISDYFSAKRQKMTFLHQSLYRIINILATIQTVRKIASGMDKITNQKDLEKINNVLFMSDLPEEISKLETLLEKTIPSNIDKQHPFSTFPELKIGLKGLLLMSEMRSENFTDIKPDLMKNMSDCEKQVYDIVETIRKDYHTTIT